MEDELVKGLQMTKFGMCLQEQQIEHFIMTRVQTGQVSFHYILKIQYVTLVNCVSYSLWPAG